MCIYVLYIIYFIISIIIIITILIRSPKQQLEYIWHWTIDPIQTFGVVPCKTEFSMYRACAHVTSQCIFSTVTKYGLNKRSKVTRWWIFQTASYHQPVNNCSTPYQPLLVVLKIHDCQTCMPDINYIVCGATTKCESCSAGWHLGKSSLLNFSTWNFLLAGLLGTWCHCQFVDHNYDILQGRKPQKRPETAVNLAWSILLNGGWPDM